jgi:hypothetical protein
MPAPQLAKGDSAPANSCVTASAFKGHLQEAIQARQGETKDTKKDGANQEDNRETTKKKDDGTAQPVVVAALQVMLPAAPAANFGLPSAGVEPGPKTEGTPKAPTTSELGPDFSTGVQTATSIMIDPPEPPAAAVQAEPKAELAFALRLADITPQDEAKQPQQQTAWAQAPDEVQRAAIAPALERDQSSRHPAIAQSALVRSALSELHAAAQAIPSAAATADKAQQPSASAAEPVTILQPARAARPTPQVAPPPVPAISASPQRGGASAQSDSHAPDSSASDKRASKESPKPEQSAVNPLRQTTTAAEAVNSVSKETPLQAPGPAPTADAAATPAPRAPETPNIPRDAASVEHVSAAPAALRSNPTSTVTDISVSVPVPRPDAVGDERATIRMVQRGQEIHVSVRTPDTQVAQALRQDLGKLSAGLDQAGFRTETWRPTAAGAAPQSNSNSHREPSQGSPNRDSAGSGPQSGGQNGRGAGEQRRRQQEERPRWVAELEQQTNP